MLILHSQESLGHLEGHLDSRRKVIRHLGISLSSIWTIPITSATVWPTCSLSSMEARGLVMMMGMYSRRSSK